MSDLLYALGIILGLIGSAVLVFQKDNRMVLGGFVLMILTLILTVSFPLVQEILRFDKIANVWVAVHALGGAVGGIATVIMKLIQKQRDREDESWGVTLGVMLTFVWIFGFAFLRKYLEV